MAHMQSVKFFSRAGTGNRAGARDNSAAGNVFPRFLIPALAALLLFLIARICCVTSFPAFLFSEDRKFERFTQSVFRSEMESNTLNRHFTVASPSDYGLDTENVTLGDASLGARRQSCAAAENYLNTLKTFDYEKLSEQHQLTYDVFRDCLETELDGAPYLLYDEPLSPALGVQAQLPILFAEYTFHTKGDIEDYLTLLSQVPDYFSSLLAFEKAKSEEGLFMSRACADEVVRQCQDFIANPESNYLIEIFDEKIDAVKNLSADEKIAYKNRNCSILTGYVIPAYETMIRAVSSLADSSTNAQGLYYYPEGQNYYRYLVRSTVGDDRSIEEIEEAVKVQMVEDFTAVQTLMKQYTGRSSGDAGTTAEGGLAEDAGSASGGADSIREDSAGAVLSGAADRLPDSPEEILNELRQKITTDFPALQNVSYTVKYVPKSLQSYLSPAFYLTPALDDYRDNVIYINPAGNYSGLELFTTLAHEGYPGHLYQSVCFSAQKPDLLRNLMDVGGYTEGWATYVEMYAYSLWDEDPLFAALSQRNRSFTLGLASLLDIGIHYRGYSLEQTTAFLEQLGFGSDTAESLYRAILEDPANYLQYYVGYLNFQELRDRMQERMGDRFSLREFHRQVLESGPMPFYLLRRRILPDAQEAGR